MGFAVCVVAVAVRAVDLSPIVGGALALALLVEIARARRRVVIRDMLDHTRDAPDRRKGRPVVSGAATLVAQELARLHRLYEAVDEHRAFATDIGASRPLNATLSPGTLDDSLRGAVSLESSVGFGPLAIPAGFVVAALGRLARGPELVLALHRTERGRVLTAQLVRPGAPDRFWRVAEDSGSPRDALVPEKMLNNLARAIFADLSLDGTINPRAAGRFLAGVEIYRSALPTKQRALLKLNDAERKFTAARAADRGFGLAYYNLGVVYSEMAAITGLDHMLAAAQGRVPGVRRGQPAPLAVVLRAGVSARRPRRPRRVSASARQRVSASAATTASA